MVRLASIALPLLQATGLRSASNFAPSFLILGGNKCRHILDAIIGESRPIVRFPRRSAPRRVHGFPDVEWLVLL